MSSIATRYVIIELLNFYTVAIIIAQNQSIKLLEFFEEMQRSLNISTERFHLLQCFLNPESMIKMEEVPNPLNPNAEVLECTDDGKIKRKQPPSNVPKVDPIWEFFYPSDGHQGMYVHYYYSTYVSS